MSLFVAGKSGNPEGRPRNRYSAKTIKGLTERWLKKQMTPGKLTKIFDQLSAKDKAELIVSLIPFCAPRMTDSGISKEEVDKLYDMVEQSLKNQQHGKAI
jgi:hypothetical protein